MSDMADIAEDPISDIQRLGWETFKRALTGLMTDHRGEWVAYHGSDQVAMAPSKQEVYDKLGTAYPMTEIVVSRIVPLGPPVNLSRPRRRARVR